MNILVLCTGNSARSILLESLLNTLGQGRIRAWSAGSRPLGRVHPLALDLLRREGHDLQGLRSKSWAQFAGVAAPEMDAVITVCNDLAGEVCPLWNGAPVRGHWALPDPAREPDDRQAAAFERAFAVLAERARAFLSLSPETLGPTALAAAIRVIGQD